MIQRRKRNEIGMQKTEGNKRINMCEKKHVKKTKRFLDNRRLTKSETFIYPVGIASAQSMN